MLNTQDTPRRTFLKLAGAGALYAGIPAIGAGGKQLRGIFPIAQSPFTESGALDLDDMVRQLRFLDRCGAHGFVWPQLASEWSSLTEKERLEGAEAIAGAGKKLRPAIVIGVQGPDTAAAVRYARHAAKLGVDALISLPPSGVTDEAAVLEYYRQVGSATELPLFVQAVGKLSVESILKMWKAVPTLRYVKDEAGEPLMRIGPLREKSSDAISVFTGGHGRTLIDEMARGTSGSMPAASFADLYASSWDLWHAGKRNEAMDVFGKALLFITEIQVYGIESLKYILFRRGVFKTCRVRRTKPQTAQPANVPAAGGLETRARFDEQGKQTLDGMLAFVKPYLKA